MTAVVKPVRTVIIEDETLVANMLEICLSHIPSVTVVGTAHCGITGVELCLKSKPDLVLLDLELPNLSGLEVARKLGSVLPKTRLVVVSSHSEPHAIHELIHLKIHGFVDKGSSVGLLIDTIRGVLAGKRTYSPAFEKLREELRQNTEAYQKILTRREIEVLMLVAAEQDDTSIAKRLNISPNTAFTHRRNIRLKLNAHNDRDLRSYARQWGLAPLTPTPQ